MNDEPKTNCWVFRGRGVTVFFRWLELDHWVETAVFNATPDFARLMPEGMKTMRGVSKYKLWRFNRVSATESREFWRQCANFFQRPPTQLRTVKEYQQQIAVEENASRK
jgi:hypothetical protein